MLAAAVPVRRHPGDGRCPHTDGENSCDGNSLRLHFPLQELVQKKLELAELTEDYEQVCHAFMKADTKKYGSILAKLKQSGSVATIPGSVAIHVTTK